MARWTRSARWLEALRRRRDAGGGHRGYEYGRAWNPTRAALETCVAALEGGSRGLAFASGMAAIEAVIKRLSAGDHVIYEENVYGGTHRMFAQVYSRLGLEFTVPALFVALTVSHVRDRPALAAAVAGASVTALALNLPHGLGLLAGAVAGAATGAVARRMS